MGSEFRVYGFRVWGFNSFKLRRCCWGLGLRVIVRVSLMPCSRIAPTKTLRTFRFSEELGL